LEPAPGGHYTDRRLNRSLISLVWLLASAAAFAEVRPWVLPNFAERLEVDVSNPSDRAVETLAVVPVAEAARVALRFPGTLAIALIPGDPPAILPTQSDDLDGDGVPDEFLFPVALAPRETRTVHIYYSTTLNDRLPWPKRVHASHAYGYNHSTIALESEVIGYRTYGGFFLDVQARAKGRPGLNNSLVGYFGTGSIRVTGMDVIHLGDTLGLGGLFLRSGTDVYRPPLNMPDYAHKPSAVEVPHYTVISDGPWRATVKAEMERWRIGNDVVRVEAWYSIAAGAAHIDCRYRITPLSVSRRYEVGAGIRHLPKLQTDNAPGRLALWGQQTDKIGPLGLALYYDPAAATRVEPLVTREDRNECVIFKQTLDLNRCLNGRYQVAAAWSGSGIADLPGELRAIELPARASVTTGNFRHARTPDPQRVEGEAY
jgi:hypothetical protein